ncbi:hypothetical protein [Hyphomonas sp.]|uniref:hypothetical protein n=1 Tax=Hyphomonas sp. TaxID=87 RepID=UPI0025B80819|nr:hypothetical protein [Hyphomonas sp.]MBI1401436.1 hypothetical protein [Hyphomonas sp.]
MNLSKIPAPRLERLIRVADQRAAGKRPAEIAASERVSTKTLQLDFEILAVQSRAELAVHLARRAKSGHRAAPAGEVSPCVFYVVREGRAERCGAAARGQYCEAHKRATSPGEGQSFPLRPRTLIKSNGGKPR